MHYCRHFLVITLSFISFLCSSQTATYNITLHGMKVGHQTVTQNVENGITTVEVKSEAKVSLGFSYTIAYHQLARYNDNHLTESTVVITKNGKQYGTSHTKWVNDHYEVNQDGKKTEIPGELHYATTKLYFNQPKMQHHRIYSEADCTIKVLSETDQNTVLVSEPNVSRGGHYSYKNGVMHKAVIDHSFVNFVIELDSYTP